MFKYKSSDNFQFLKCIGQNANGPIYLARNKKNTANVVIKIIPSFFVEKRISSIVSQFSKINHPALSTIQGIIDPDRESPTHYRFVSDFFENGSLSDIYKRFPFSFSYEFWNPTRKSIIAFGIAAAMQFLHYKYITHQFLTPYNILFDKFYQPHISDYWFSSFLPRGSQQNASFGQNSIYVAPECLGINNITSSVDVFSYGIILYELAFEKPLYNNEQITLADVVKDITSKSLRNTNFSNKLCNLIINCIQLDPLKRPSFDYIVASFYDDLDPLFLNTNLPFFSQYRLSIIKSHVREMSKISLFEYGNNPANRRNKESMLEFVQSSECNIKPLFKYAEMTKNFSAIKFAADKGNKSAQYAYALKIEKDNKEEAIKYLKMAADQNYMKAVEKLMILDPDDSKYLKKAADLGSPKARIKYALRSNKLYYLKMAAKRFNSEAFLHSQNGNLYLIARREALFLLAQREENGHPVKFLKPSDYNTIIASFEKANPELNLYFDPSLQTKSEKVIDFENDDPKYPFKKDFFVYQDKAYKLISSISENVIYKDLYAAVNHYNQAVALNSSEAINRLDQIEKNGQKLVSKCTMIFSQSDKKKIDELVMYAIMLLKGSFNVERNVSQATRILTSAAKYSSSPDAQYILFKLMRNDSTKFSNYNPSENYENSIDNYYNEDGEINDNSNSDNNNDNEFGNKNNINSLKNEIESLKYLKAAAEQGHPRACFHYAQHLTMKNSVQGKPPKITPSLRYYRQSANLGNIKGIFTYSSIVQCYYNYKTNSNGGNYNFNYGFGYNYNYNKYAVPESIVYCRIAADRGLPQAQFLYGKFLENKKIDIKNFSILKVKNDENSNFEEEDMFEEIEEEEEEEYAEGIDGVNNKLIIDCFLHVRKENMTKALFYYKLAAKQGMTEAMLAIAELYEKEKSAQFCDMKINERDITKKYLVAGSCGEAQAMHIAGQRFAQGIGVPPDPEQALVYFRVAAFLGNITAQYKYGHYLAFNSKTKKSEKERDANEGLRFLILAVSQGYNMNLLMSLFTEFDSMNVNDVSNINNYINMFKYSESFNEDYFIDKIHSIDNICSNQNSNNNNKNIGVNGFNNLLLNKENKNNADVKGNHRMNSLIASYSACLFASQSIGLLFKSNNLNGKPDLNEAMFWLEESANLGMSDTFYYIGEIFEKWKEYDQAFQTYQYGHQDGIINCTLKLAHCYEKGLGCPRDIETAAELYESIGPENISYYLNAAKLYDRVYQQLSRDAKRNRIKQRNEMKSNIIKFINGIRNIDNDESKPKNVYENNLIGNFNCFVSDQFDDDDDDENDHMPLHEKEMLKRIYSLYSKAVVSDDAINTAHFRMGQILISDSFKNKNKKDQNDENDGNEENKINSEEDLHSFLLSDYNKKEFGITFLQEAFNNGNTDAMVEMASFIKSGAKINLEKRKKINANMEDASNESENEDYNDIFFCGNRLNHNIIYINFYSDEQKVEFMHNLIIKASRRGNYHANVIYASALINYYKNHISDKNWMKMVGKGFKIIKRVLDKYNSVDKERSNPLDDFYFNFISSFDEHSNDLHYSSKNENFDEDSFRSLVDAATDAYILLAKLYQEGNGVMKNTKRAINLCFSASELGHQTAMMKANRIAMNESRVIKTNKNKFNFINDEKDDDDNDDKNYEDDSLNLNDEVLIELKDILDSIFTDLVPEMFQENLKKIERIAYNKNCWQAQFVLGQFYNGNEIIERQVDKVLFFFRMAANNIIINDIKTDILYDRSDVFMGLGNILVEKNMLESALFYFDKAIELGNQEAIRKKLSLILNNYSAKGCFNDEISSYESSTFTPSIEDIDLFYGSMRNRLICKSKNAFKSSKIRNLDDLSSSLGFLKTDDDGNLNDIHIFKKKEFLFGRDIYLSSFGSTKSCVDLIFESYTVHDIIKSFYTRNNIAYIMSSGLKVNRNTNLALEYLRESADAEMLPSSQNSLSSSNSRHLFYKYNYEYPDDSKYYLNLEDEKCRYDAGGYSQYQYAKLLINIAEKPNKIKAAAKSASASSGGDNNNNNEESVLQQEESVSKEKDIVDSGDVDVAARFIADHYLEQAASMGNIEAIRLLSSLKVDSNPTMSSHYGKLGSDLGDRLSMTRRACDLIFGSVLIGYRVSYSDEKSAASNDNNNDNDNDDININNEENCTNDESINNNNNNNDNNINNDNNNNNSNNNDNNNNDNSNNNNNDNNINDNNNDNGGTINDNGGTINDENSTKNVTTGNENDSGKGAASNESISSTTGSIDTSHEVPISFVGKSFMRESRSLLEVVSRTSGRAAFVLGALFEGGELLEKNYRKAFEYYSASAALGFRESLLRMSAILAFGGFGLERDERRSLRYAQSAAFFRVPLAVKAKEEGKLEKLNDKFVDFIASVMERSIPMISIQNDDSKTMKVYIENKKNESNTDENENEKKSEAADEEKNVEDNDNDNDDDKKGFKLRRNECCTNMSELFKDCFGVNGIIYGICDDDCEYDHEYEYEYEYEYEEN